MDISFEEVLYYFVLIDAVSACVASWTGFGAYLNRRSALFGQYFPITKGWTTYYLILVLWIGYSLTRLGILDWSA